MLTALLVIAIIYAVIWLLPRLLRRLLPWLVQRQMKKMFNAAGFDPSNMGGQQGSRQGGTRRDSNPSQHAHTARHKKIDDSVGEYVEFTELDEPYNHFVRGNKKTESRYSGGRVSDYGHHDDDDDRISDVDWEDL